MTNEERGMMLDDLLAKNIGRRKTLGDVFRANQDKALMKRVENLRQKVMGAYFVSSREAWEIIEKAVENQIKNDSQHE